MSKVGSRKTSADRGKPSQSRDALIKLLQAAPGTNRCFAEALGLRVSTVSQLIVEMRALGNPIYIKSWERSPVTRCWAAVYAWGEGVDARVERFKQMEIDAHIKRVRPADIRPRRDWGVEAMFGSYGERMTVSRDESGDLVAHWAKQDGASNGARA